MSFFQAWKKSSRILKNADFKSVFLNGKKLNGKIFRLYILPEDKSNVSFGIAITKKIKNAVNRNYYKRVIREILRRRITQFTAPQKVIVNIPVIPGPKVNYHIMEQELIGLCIKAKILENE
jgi:ribonuclease P protein component